MVIALAMTMGLVAQQLTVKDATALTALVEQGNAEAQYAMADYYSSGVGGVQQSMEEYLRLLRLSAAQGYDRAQVDLAVCYINGVGELLPQSVDEGVRMLKAAVDKGSAYAMVVYGSMCVDGVYVEKDVDEGVRLVRKAVEKGEPEGIAVLALLYIEGIGVYMDTNEAVRLLNEGVKKNSVLANCYLGLAYLGGEIVPRNESEGLRLLQFAADKGETTSMCVLAKSYLTGQHGRTDMAKGLDLLRRAAVAEDSMALYELGLMYLMGNYVSQNWDEGLKMIFRAAELGNMDACFVLGKLYLESESPEMMSEGEAYLRKAAENEHASAQAYLGVILLTQAQQAGLEQKKQEAIQWLIKSVEQGNAEAQFVLAVMYEKGNGVQQSWSEAIKLLRASAEQGCAEAQHELGAIYLRGVGGVMKSEATGAKLVKCAAESGYAQAQVWLGDLYLFGVGVPKSQSQAVIWYRKSIEQGNAFAMFRMGQLYGEGNGVLRSWGQAQQWLIKAYEAASAIGDELHAQLLDDITKYVNNHYCAESLRLISAAQEVQNGVKAETSQSKTSGVYTRMISRMDMLINIYGNIINHAASCQECGGNARKDLQSTAATNLPHVHDLRDTCQRQINAGYTGDSTDDFMTDFWKGFSAGLMILPLFMGD